MLMVLAVGALLRLMMLVALPQPLATFTDANVYVRAAQDGLFKPFEGRTAGYPLFLRTAHGVWDAAIFPVLLQHLLAIATGALAYVVARAGGVPRLGATLVTACCVLTIDGLWLEHQLLTETVASFLVVASLALIVGGPGLGERVANGRATAMLAVVVLSSLVAALALGGALTRPALFPAMPGVGLCVLLLPRAAWRVRLAAAAIVLVVAVGLLLSYLQAQADETGVGTIVATPAETDLGNYSNVAPVAECRRFVVPPGTESLCERSDPDTRRGGDFYFYDPDSPARRLLQARPGFNDPIKLWASRATAAHGAQLRSEKLQAFRRLFGLGGLQRPVTDQGTQILDLDRADDMPADVALVEIRRYYGADSLSDEEAGAPWGVLVFLQPFTRLSGLVMLTALLAAIGGVLLGRGRARLTTLAVGVTAWTPVVVATWASATFNWRYVMPSIPLIALAAVAGVVALRSRLSSRAGRPGP